MESAMTYNAAVKPVGGEMLSCISGLVGESSVAPIKNKVSGIYKITSPSGKIYIGQSVNIRKRFYDYKGLHNCSEQGRLFNSLKKYGWDAHKAEVIHECSTDELNRLEVYYITLYNSLDNKVGMNIREGGDSKKHSPETCAKISSSNKGRKMSDESKLKMSISRKGKTPWNKNMKGAQVAWNKGKPLTSEHIQNTRLANIGRKDNEQARLNKSIAAKGKPKSKEHAAKVGAKHKGKLVSLETREKQRIARINFVN